MYLNAGKFDCNDESSAVNAGFFTSAAHGFAAKEKQSFNS